MDIAEKRVYDASGGRTRLAVATGQGLAIVGVSADVIGEFGLALREPVRDVAVVGDGRLLVATERDLLVVAVGEGGVAETLEVAETGAGETAAVAVDDDAVIAAGGDGVRRASRSSVLGTASEADEPDAHERSAAWTDLGEATVRRADRTLLAAEEGVYRVTDASIEHVGLEDVLDVAVPASGAGVGPLAATESGLFRLGPGWTEERAGGFDFVATVDGGAVSDGGAELDLPAAYAAAGADLLARTDGEWSPVEWPLASPVAGIVSEGGGRPIYAVAEDGTVLADAGDGWRTRSIGLRGVTACAVVE